MTDGPAIATLAEPNSCLLDAGRPRKKQCHEERTHFHKILPQSSAECRRCSLGSSWGIAAEGLAKADSPAIAAFAAVQASDPACLKDRNRARAPTTADCLYPAAVG